MEVSVVKFSKSIRAATIGASVMTDEARITHRPPLLLVLNSSGRNASRPDVHECEMCSHMPRICGNA